MSVAMKCPEYIRLRDDYELSIRAWAKVMRLPDDDAKLAAFDARNEALSRLTAHREFCPTCIKDKRRIQGARSA
jgi:hypothetical protein